MVQLSLSQFRRLSPPREDEKERGRKMTKQKHSPASSPGAFCSPQSVQSSAATSLSQAYDTYIENGLICLKHKIRNIEKKKVKLEDYRERMRKGEPLNQDQTEAVEKYDETIHNLEFAKELHKTFSALSQDLVKVQKKTQRREQALRMEAEKKRLRTALQVHYVLQNLGQEHVQKDFRDGLNGAMYVSSRELNYLIRFCKLVSIERDEKLSLEDQMEQISSYLWELLEGSETTVAGTTYKRLKELLGNLLECGYFECIPIPHSEMQEEQEVMLKEPENQKLKEKLTTLKELVIADKGDNIRERSSSDNIRERSSSDNIRERSVEISELLQNEVPLGPREFLNRRYVPEPEYDLKTHEEDVQSFFNSEEPPDSWDMQSIERIEKRQQPLITKLWGDSLVSKEQEPKKSMAKPKEKREVPQKHIAQPKQVSKPEQQQPPALEFISSNSSKSLPHDPALRQQELQDIIAQFQGTCNFMQDSMLDFDKSSAIPSPLQRSPCTLTASPKVSKTQNPQNQNEFIQSTTQAPLPEEVHKLITPPSSVTADEHSLSGSEIDLHSLPSRKESISMPSEEMSFIPSQTFEKETAIPEPLVRKTSIDTTQVKMSLPVESQHQEPPASTPLTVPTEPAFQTTTATTTTSSSTTSTPFQTVQTVFKMNAPLPQRNEKEVKTESAFSTTFNQSYTTASTQTPPSQSSQQMIHKTEQSTVVQDSLQTALGTCQLEGTTNVSYLPQQPSGFHRPNQAYFNNRGSVRGALRGGRGAVASYRPQNGFKAGFDSYRGGSHVIQNGIYIQPAYPGRDYAGMPCMPRETVSQQSYKRGGSVGGHRASSRGAGWSDSSQVSSPERDNETLNSGDSGQGDSRSITPVDGPVTSQAATVLPMHVYPLPQQMRVAFSTARTSNFAPGTLDQPIVFDLLLNNLGETFDIQLGRFTCPVNGTYVFIFHMLKLAVNVPLYVNLMKNEEVLVSAYANDGAPDHETASNHAVLQLFQGDQIWLRLHRGAIYGSSWKYSTFSGYLLYQD